MRKFLPGRRILVCGGRGYRNYKRLWAVLEEEHEENSIRYVCHGAARGADTLAGQWGQRKSGVFVREYPANWEQFGRSAGPVRNIQMLHEVKPHVVIVAPGGNGTQHMANLAISSSEKNGYPQSIIYVGGTEDA